MRKTAWGVVSAILALLIVVILFAGLDNLPKGVRQQIAQEKQALSKTEEQLRSSQDELRRALSSEPKLFQARAMNAVFPERLKKADSSISTARKEMSDLEAIAKKNSKRDRQRAEDLLRQEAAARRSAEQEINGVQSEVRRWLDLKKNLPKYLAEQEQNYQVAKSFDLGSVAATVQKAETDWPAKRNDLENRLTSLKSVPAQAEQIWSSTADMRQQVRANPDSVDLADLVTKLDPLTQLRQRAAQGPQELASLADQLYTSYDKILVDLDKKGAPETYQEKIKTVRTKQLDSTAEKVDVKSDEKWVEVPKNVYVAHEDKLGMAIEHKPTGVYDSEANKTPQPAGFAYVAPPGQRNQYGYWETRNGSSVWTFLPQYLLMRELLYNRQYVPPYSYEYDRYYSAQRSNQTYYGRDETSADRPKYGSYGSTTVKRYSDSKYVNSGSYRGSRYASRSGTPDGKLEGSKFGRGRDDQPAVATPGRPYGGNRPSYSSPSGRSYGGSSSGYSSRPSGRSYGGSSSPSRSSSSSGGRRFGRR